jgi:chromosome segregation ATPase
MDLTFENLVLFLDQCQETKRLNQHQISYLMSGYTDNPENFGDLVAEMGITGEMKKFQDEAKAKEIQANQEMIRDFIQETEKDLAHLERELEPLEIEVEELEAHYRNCRGRSDPFPENPKLREITSQAEGKFDLARAKVLKHQQEIEEAKRKIANWKSQLD